MDKKNTACLIEDVIHAFLWFLDPNHLSTLMLVCDYEVRCIAFNSMEELTTWVELLKTYLKCNYFHADLVLASKKSKLYNHARRRCRQLRSVPSHKLSHSNLGTNASGVFRVSASCCDGYLHVTHDRICFTTGPSCARPRLLASWSLENDDLIQCGTARSKRDGIESDLFFFLTASPEHPEAPDGHLFIAAKANELCELIEANSRIATYQAEWRRLTSIAAALDIFPSSPSSSVSPQPDTMTLLARPETSFTVLRSTNLSSPPAYCTSCGYPLIRDHSVAEHPCECDHNSSEFDAPNAFANMATEHSQIERQFQEALEEVSERESQESPAPSSLSAPPSPQQHETKFSQNATAMGQMDICRLTTASLHTSHPSNESPCVDGNLSDNYLTQAEFVARKRSAINSRRRFSSHPMEVHGRTSDGISSLGYCFHSNGRSSIHPLSECPSGQTAHSAHANPLLPSSCLTSESHSPLMRGWRQSDPHLVTLPSQPIPLHELGCFLRRLRCECSHFSDFPHPSSYHVTTECDNSGNDATTAPAVSCGRTTHHRLSECSTVSTDGLVHSGQPSSQCSCSQCASILGAGDAQVLPISSNIPSTDLGDDVPVPHTTGAPACRRKRLPSSWSTAVCTPHHSNLTGAHIRTQSDTYCKSQPPSLIRSLSSGNSPHCMYTPLLPTPNVIPGSQYFFHRRYHTTSASEVVSSSNQDPTLTISPSLAVSPTYPNAVRWTAKASLVSLSPTSLPLWAEAPGCSKPRTGKNYVSREALLAIHAHRKQHLSSDHSSPSGGRHPDEQSTTRSSSIPLDSSDIVLTDGLKRNPLVQPSSCAPASQSVKERNIVKMQAPSQSASDQRLDALSLAGPDTALAVESPLMEMLPVVGKELSSLGRSYINVAAGRRTSLQPIAEREMVHPLPTHQVTSRTVGPLPTEDTSALLLDIFGETGDSVSSYVNVSDASVIGARSTSYSSTPFVATAPLASSQSYVNLRGPATTDACGMQRTQPSIHGAHGSAESDFVVSVSSTSSTSGIRSTRETTTSRPPQLHYAHLTLSTSPTRCSLVTSCQPPIPSASISPAAVDCPLNLRGVQLVSSTLSQIACNSSTFKGINTTSVGDENDDASSAGLNYVTIDSFHTKALSEVEKELRLRAATSRPLSPAGRQQRWRSYTRRGAFTSNTLPATMTRDEPLSSLCNVTYASGHSGVYTNNILCSSSSSLRFFHRLVAYFQSKGNSARKATSSCDCRHLHQFGKAT